MAIEAFFTLVEGEFKRIQQKLSLK